jgi:hypothetical protein
MPDGSYDRRMTRGSPHVVRNRLAVAAVAGLLSVIGRFFSADLLEDPWKSGVDAAFEAIVVIVVGVGVAAVLERRVAQREARHRAAARIRLLERLGPNLKLAANGWVHLLGSEEDTSVPAGIEALREACGTLTQIERELGELQDGTLDEPSMKLFLSKVWASASRYWFEGAPRIRIHYLIGVRAALQSEVADASELVREQFVQFAGALDLADGAALKTAKVVQENLVAGELGTPIDRRWTHKSPEASESLRSVAELAAGAMDPVLQVVIVADVLKRAAPADPSEDWRRDVRGTLGRCVGALKIETANVRNALELLLELVERLQQEHRDASAFDA